MRETILSIHPHVYNRTIDESTLRNYEYIVRNNQAENPYKNYAWNDPLASNVYQSDQQRFQNYSPKHSE